MADLAISRVILAAETILLHQDVVNSRPGKEAYWDLRNLHKSAPLNILECGPELYHLAQAVKSLGLAVKEIPSERRPAVLSMLSGVLAELKAAAVG